MTENELMENIRQLVNLSHLVAYHTRDSRGSWSPGFPDLIIAGPGGVIFREVKSHQGRLAKSQWDWGNRLLEAGADWGVWRPGDWPENITEQLNQLAKI